MPVPKKKRTTSTPDPSTSEPSSPVLPEQQVFHQYLRTLAQSAVRIVIETVMREELDQFIGAAWGECSPKRKGYRNGHYTRDLVTSTGRLEEIKVPRDREGQFQTQIFDRYSRDVQQVADGLTQMFVSGTSTHKVGEVAQTLMGVAPSGSSVSRLNRSLTEQFEVWRECPLLAHYRLLYLDDIPSWHTDRSHDHFNGPGCGSGREQRYVSIAGLCGGRQRWMELSFTRCAYSWSQADRSDYHRRA